MSETFPKMACLKALAAVVLFLVLAYQPLEDAKHSWHTRVEQQVTLLLTPHGMPTLIAQ